MKIVIIIQYPSYNLFESLSVFCRNNGLGDILNVLVPFGSSITHPPIHSIAELREYFDKHKLSYIIGCDDSGASRIKIQDLNPDVILLQVPYDLYRVNPEFKSDKLSQAAPVACVSYGASMIKHDFPYDGLISNNEVYKNCSAIFVESNILEKEYNQTYKDLRKFHSIGYGKCAKYFTTKNLTKNKNFRKTIAWKPRWIGTLGHSNLLKYLEFFLSYIAINRDINFIFYSHPLLKKQLIDKEIATLEAVDEIFLRFRKSQNCIIVEDGDFLDQIMWADIYVGDFSSTLAEFFYTGKPIIYTPLNVTLNEFGTKIVEGCYTASDTIEMEMHIRNLLASNDVKRDKRQALLKSMIEKENPIDAGKKLFEGITDFVIVPKKMAMPTTEHIRKERDLKVSTCAKNQTTECPEILN